MICITGQIESTEWSIAQNEAACIVIPVKTMQWSRDPLSFSIRCAEPRPVSWFVCGAPRHSEGLVLSANVVQVHPNYLLNEAEPEFHRLCLTVSRFARKIVRRARQILFSGRQKMLCKPTAVSSLTGVLRL